MPERKTVQDSIVVPANFALSAADVAFVVELAQSAGALAVSMRDGATVEEKSSPTDLVTSADKALSELIMKALAERFPADVVLSEEAPWLNTPDGRRRWIIDPIDGTKFYVDGSGKYCIMIGLEQGGRELFGCFAIPAHQQTLFGGPGMGTYRVVDDVVRKVDALDALAPDKPVRVLISNNDLKANPWVAGLAGVEIVTASSIGIDVWELLTGRADVFVHIRPTLGYWDTAAPGAVAQGFGLDVGTDVGDAIEYGYTSWRHTDHIVIGKKGSLVWWRSMRESLPSGAA
jgi:3'-phosphoadenosine 5'-phosphosulfate (PAPS) 3'-phosphatase